MIIPNVDMEFIVIPTIFATINIPANEKGIPTDTQPERRKFIKKPRVKITIPNPIKPLFFRRFKRFNYIVSCNLIYVAVVKFGNGF